MPFITDPSLQELPVVDELEKKATELEQDLYALPPTMQVMAQPEKEKPVYSETLKAAMKTENIVGAAVNEALMKDDFLNYAGIDQFVKQKDFGNVYDQDLSGYEDYLDEFSGIKSHYELEFKKMVIDENIRNRKVIEESGFAAGASAMLLANGVDPTILIPLAGAGIKIAQTGKSIYNIGKMAGSVAAIETGREAILHHYQPARTVEESVINIGGATILTGLLGAAAHGISAATRIELERDIDTYLSSTFNKIPVEHETFKDIINDPNAPEIKFNETVTPHNGKDLSKVANMVLISLTKKLQKGEINQQYLTKAETHFANGEYNSVIGMSINKQADIPTAADIKAVEKQMNDEYGSDVFREEKSTQLSADDLNKLNQLGASKRSVANKVIKVEELLARKQSLLDEVDNDHYNSLQNDLSKAEGEFNRISGSDSPDTVELMKAMRAVKAIRQEIEPLEKQYKKVTDEINQIDKEIGDFDIAEELMGESMGPHSSAGSMAVTPPSRETNMYEETLVGGSVMETLSVGLSARMAGSSSLLVRKLGQKLANDSFVRRKNKMGIKNEQSWESLIERHDKDIREAVIGLKTGFKEYSMRLPREQRVLKSFDDFDAEVAKAMRRGDTHPIPEVEQAAKLYRSKFDKLKTAAIRAGIFPEDVNVKFALSYLPRVYNRNKINKNLSTFRRKLAGEISKSLPPEFEGQLGEFVDDIISNILGSPEKGNTIGLAGRSSVLKSRKLELSDEFLEEWMESSVTNLYNTYHKTLVPRIEFFNRFEGKTINEIKAEVTEEFRNLRAGEDNATAAKLKKEEGEVLDAIDKVYHRGIGTVQKMFNPSGAVARTLHTAKELSRIQMLGGVVVTSLVDIVRPVMINGMMPYARVIGKMIAHPSLARLALREKRTLVAALEVIEQTRAQKFADVLDDYQGGTKFEKGVDATGKLFSQLSILPAHNSFWKSLTGQLGQNEIIRMAEKVTSGKRISSSLKTKMAKWGIDDDLASRINDQVKKYGTGNKDLRQLNLDEWDDWRAANAIEMTLHRIANETINTPGIGTLPHFFDNQLASTMMQFKSFMFASWNQTLLTGIQHADAAALSSLSLMVGMGAVVIELKDLISGIERKRDIGTYIKEAIDRSGVLSIPMEINNISDKVFGISVDNAFDLGGADRYVDRNVGGAVAGPALNMLVDVAEMTGSRTRLKEWKQSDTRKMRRLLPFQNLFYLNRLLTMGEKKFNKSMKIKK